jgi:anthranilate phosphoribosyltransferase
VLSKAIIKLQNQQPLSHQEAKQLFEDMLKDETAKEQIAAAMALLNLQKDNIELFTGILESMREHMLQVKVNAPLLDIVGTGGDHANTVNISTGAALVLASCGIKVAKHGNRAKTSKCGSADVLEELGISIDNPPEQVEQSIAENNFGFCLAPTYHPSWGKLAATRRALAVPCIFNFMGPLVNPAKAEYLMLGVADKTLVPLFAKILARLNIKKAIIFNSNGVDELTTASEANACIVEGNKYARMTINPSDFGLARCTLEELKGGDKAFNAQALKEAFSGKSGAIADTLALNAGVGIYLTGNAETIKEGIAIAQQAMQSGQVLKLLEKIAK